MAGLLRLVAILMCAIVALGFALFTIDELDRGSKTQQQAIDQQVSGREQVIRPAPTPEEEAVREKQQGKVREYIDDANDVLLSPFSELVSGSTSSWLTHGVPAVLALLIYGLGLGLVANFLPKTKAQSGSTDWRTA